MNSIFILGITGRSGTNYLSSILKNHQNTKGFHIGGEDFLIYGTDTLDNYVKKISDKWNFRIKNDKEKYSNLQKKIKQSIGDGILNFVSNKKNNDIKYIAKTPSTVNISKFFDFFPNSKLIILVRDGRAVVESGVKSKFWNYEKGFLIWNKSAERILNFQEKNKAKANQFLIVKYENLISSLEDEAKKILAFCDLEINKYNFSEIDNIKLLGTSVNDKKNNDDFKWKKKEKPKNFNPLNRAKNWKKIKHIRYNAVCGKNAKKLKYELKHEKKNIFLSFINLLYNFIYFYEKIKYRIKPI